MLDKKVIFIVFFSFLIACLIALFDKNEMSDEKYKALFVYKTFTDDKFPLIIAGDSRVYRGISPKILEKKLGLKGLNLGFSSGGFGHDLFDLIDKALDQSHQTKIIILAITPFSLTEKAASNRHIHDIKKFKKEEVLEYKYLFNIKNFFAPYTPALIHSKLKNLNKNNYIQEMHIYEGWIASSYLNPQPYSALNEYKRVFTENKISENVIRNLYKKIHDWSINKIEVYGFYIPSSVNMNELEKNVGGFNKFDFVKGFLEAGGYWINIEEKYTSYDGSHLDKESAVRLSNEIAYKIKHKQRLTVFNDKISFDDIYKPSNYKFFKEIFNMNLNDSVLHNKIENEKNKTKKILFFDDPSKFIANNIKRIELQISVFYNDSLTGSAFCCSVKNDLVEINTDNSTTSKKWCKLFLSKDIPDNINERDSICIFIKNPNNKSILTDSLKIYYFDK